MKFAKLFDLENDEQVLLTSNYNEHDDEYEIEVRTDFEGVSAEVKMSFKSEERAQKAMDTYKQENAIAFRSQMSAMFE